MYAVFYSSVFIELVVLATLSLFDYLHMADLAMKTIYGLRNSLHELSSNSRSDVAVSYIALVRGKVTAAHVKTIALPTHVCDNNCYLFGIVQRRWFLRVRGSGILRSVRSYISSTWCAHVLICQCVQTGVIYGVRYSAK